MKSFVRLTIALAMLIPVGALSAGPAGAAGGTTCKPPSGKITVSPGITTVKKVQTITINLPVAGCVGGGVTSGVFKGSLKTDPIDIAGFAKNTKPLKLTSTITWNTKATSSFTATTTTKIVGAKITSSVKGKITKGLFIGLTVTSAQTVTLGKPGAGGAITSLNIKGSTPFVIK
jgi:hypothetical protein